MPKARGFTLIEVLVVMLIVSIVTTVALLSVGRNQTKQMQGVINAFTQSLSLAEEQAMLAPTKIGLSVNNEGWQYWVYQEKPIAQWQPDTTDGLGSYSLPDQLTITLQVLSQANVKDINGEPQIIITSNGDITPFVLRVGERGKKPKFQVQGRVDGFIQDEVLS